MTKKERLKDGEIKKIILEIQKVYRIKMSDEEIFSHLIDQITKHVIKLTKLKENEDWEGHFQEEVADIHLLSLGLVEIEKVDDGIITKAAYHYLNKIKEIYI